MNESSPESKTGAEAIPTAEVLDALIDERIEDIQIRLEGLPSGDSVISALQNEILKIVNELRALLRSKTSEDFDGPELAGFTMGEADYGHGGPNVTSFITGEVIGHTKVSTEGTFVVDDVSALKRALKALCLEKK